MAADAALGIEDAIALAEQIRAGQAERAHGAALQRGVSIHLDQIRRRRRLQFHLVKRPGLLHIIAINRERANRIAWRDRAGYGRIGQGPGAMQAAGGGNRGRRASDAAVDPGHATRHRQCAAVEAAMNIQ